MVVEPVYWEAKTSGKLQSSRIPLVHLIGEGLASVKISPPARGEGNRQIILNFRYIFDRMAGIVESGRPTIKERESISF